MGWGHRTTAIAEYMLMFAIALTSLLILKLNLVWQITLLIIWSAVYITLMLKIDEKWNKQVSS
jgi:hypothetical protein